MITSVVALRFLKDSASLAGLHCGDLARRIGMLCLDRLQITKLRSAHRGDRMGSMVRSLGHGSLPYRISGSL